MAIRELPMRAQGVRDPVCGMNVDPEKAAATFVHDGRTYYFCAPVCRDRFQADPEWYLSLAEKAKPAMSEVSKEAQEKGRTESGRTESGAWTCPMHPEVQANGPGHCPICGMA